MYIYKKVSFSTQKVHIFTTCANKGVKPSRNLTAKSGAGDILPTLDLWLLGMQASSVGLSSRVYNTKMGMVVTGCIKFQLAKILLDVGIWHFRAVFLSMLSVIEEDAPLSWPHCIVPNATCICVFGEHSWVKWRRRMQWESCLCSDMFTRIGWLNIYRSPDHTR